MASISALGVGSGLDLTGLLDQLRAAERQKLQPITAQRTQEQAKISAFGRLQSALNKFQDATAKLNDPKLYQGLKTQVRGDGMTASAGATATPGNYEVEVLHTARAGSVATTRVTDSSEALAGPNASLELSFGDGSTRTVTFDEGATLVDMRNAINADADAGVNAAIIFDGQGHRLVLSSRESGVDAGVTGVSFAGLADPGALAEDTAARQAGRDAELKINGITITSATNRVEGAIQGVTLELTADSAGKTLGVTVQRDTDSLKEAVKSFVSAYNEMKSTIGRMTAAGSDATSAGELVGDRVVRSLESRLSRDLTNLVPGGDITMMSQLGISLRPNGRLELDESKLDDAIATNQQAVADFFAGDSKEAGLAGRLGDSMKRYLGDGGLIKSSITSSETRIDSLKARFERMETSIERSIERYRKQFSQLDMMMAQMNSMSAYLSQQFDIMNAQLGRRR
ncbi:flagellar filament capping protein FliD [Halomonas daqingensis]|uniref:Flagellar hook-associated protein 2 n=1 Tax=Billgrantia desiderata TaxID=52021 RepID=A0ABS9AZ96_9GAMM|nr:flagellar filament capping protein FliD [Halomonas desiderata]MCE8040552.1 flagellar filament capping protein FliD [Halomonas desiderata]MCE8045127.1 flagellar filament capping protein FliD [Halomonas desiderata]